MIAWALIGLVLVCALGSYLGDRYDDAQRTIESVRYREGE